MGQTNADKGLGALSPALSPLLSKKDSCKKGCPTQSNPARPPEAKPARPPEALGFVIGASIANIIFTTWGYFG